MHATYSTDPEIQADPLDGCDHAILFACPFAFLLRGICRGLLAGRAKMGFADWASMWPYDSCLGLCKFVTNGTICIELTYFSGLTSLYI